MRRKLLSVILIVAVLILMILPVFHSVSAYSRYCNDPGGGCSYCVPCIMPPGVPGAMPAFGTCTVDPIHHTASCDGSTVYPCIAGC